MDIDDAFDSGDEKEMNTILGDEKNYFKILDDTPEYEFNFKYLFDDDDNTDFDFYDRAGDFSDAYESKKVSIIWGE